jgi:prephenate dehydrogenase
MAGQHCVVVGGAGAVGRMFTGVLCAAGASVCIVEPRPPAGPPTASCALLVADITAPGAALLAELGTADLVVLAVPGPVALQCVADVLSALQPGALLVDTLSVKTEIVRAVSAHPPAAEFVSLNPMFTPSLGMSGRPVAAVVPDPNGPRAQALLDLLRHRGCHVVELTADEHDRLTAAVQALTHATILGFGLALTRLSDGLGLDPGQLAAVAPPPFVMLSALLARITAGSPATYWEVQSANPHAEAARAALRLGADDLDDRVTGGRHKDFGAAVAGLAELLGPRLTELRRQCGTVFEILPSARATSCPPPAIAPPVERQHS